MNSANYTLIIAVAALMTYVIIRIIDWRRRLLSFLRVFKKGKRVGSLPLLHAYAASE